jgi:hypothetical protein
MTPHDIFKHRIEPHLTSLMVWLNDKLVALNERLTRLKQRHGL